MNKLSTLLISCSLGLLAAPAVALDASGQRYVDQLLQGGPVSIRQAAQSIYNTNYRDQQVLDIAAEVLLKNYRGATDNTSADAMAWLCKALGRSGNGRYKAVLTEVVATSNNRKIDRHCQSAARNLPNTSNAYQAGSVDLNANRGRAHSQPARPPQQRPQTNAQQPARRPQSGQYSASFNDIRVGMSMDEVNSLLGTPTSTYSHQTGKAWIPFNYRGRDIARVIALYRDQGRIVYSQDHMYNAPWRVLEIHPNPNETGYP